MLHNEPWVAIVELTDHPIRYRSIAGQIIGPRRLRDACALPSDWMAHMAYGLPLSGLHVLVAEDEYFIAAALMRDLKKVGAVTIGPSPTVSDALKLISEIHQIDAALLNFKLRDGTSLPVAEELRRRGIPFIFITGNDDAVRALFPDAPVHLKPADMPKLVLALTDMIGERGSSE